MMTDYENLNAGLGLMQADLVKLETKTRSNRQFHSG